jgi:hypothetical protein
MAAPSPGWPNTIKGRAGLSIGRRLFDEPDDGLVKITFSKDDVEPLSLDAYGYKIK